MSRLTTFKHLLFVDKKPLYVDGFGNIMPGNIDNWKKEDGQLAKLEYSPDGWDDILVKYGRNIKNLGVIRDFAVSLKFALDGAKIIKDMLATKGFEAESIYAILKNDGEFPPTYDIWYYGEPDLSTSKSNKDGITVNILEAGPKKYLTAFENTDFEIPVDEVSVFVDGQTFTNNVEFSVYEQQLLNAFGTTDSIIDFGMGSISQEGSSQGVLISDQDTGIANAHPDNRYFIKSVTKSTVAKITNGVINCRIIGNTEVEIFIEKIDRTGTPTRSIIVSGNYSDGQFIAPEFEFDIPLDPGDSLGLRVQSADPLNGPYVFSGSFNLSYDVAFTPSLVRGIKAKTLGERLVNKMTDGKFTLKSDFLDALDQSLIPNFAELIYISGTSIRSLSNAVIKISFDDFVKSLRRFGVSVGVEGGKIVIEQLSYFFRDEIGFDLGEVDELEVSVANDLVYNTIKTGYRNNTYDEVNGTDEFNVEQKWKTAITRIVKELDLSSPVRADMYGIDLTRNRMFSQDTSDNVSDNDPFYIDCVKGGEYNYYSGVYEVVSGNIFVIPGTLTGLTGFQFKIGSTTYDVINTTFLVVGYTRLTVSQTVTPGVYSGTLRVYSAEIYQLNRPAFSPLTGLLHPDQAYNINLSPKRAILEPNNAAYIRSMIEDDGTDITFTRGDKNSDLIAGDVEEKASISVGSLPDRLFIPYYAEFETEVPNNFLQLMDEHMYKKISFTYRGNKFYGYLFDGGIKPATRDRAKFKMLLAPNTDKKKLFS